MLIHGRERKRAPAIQPAIECLKRALTKGFKGEFFSEHEARETCSDLQRVQDRAELLEGLATAVQQALATLPPETREQEVWSRVAHLSWPFAKAEPAAQ